MKHLLTKDGKRSPKATKKDPFLVPGTNDTRVEDFALFSRLFNLVLEYLLQSGYKTSIGKMVYAGSVEPGSTRVSSH